MYFQYTTLLYTVQLQLLEMSYKYTSFDPYTQTTIAN